MRNSARALTLLTLLTLILVSPMGSTVEKAVSTSDGSAKVGSREVTFKLEGNGGVFSTNKSATIAFDAGEIIIEKEQVLVNDREVAKVPEDAKLVSVEYAAGTLKISADGKTLYDDKVAN